jgi:hypothetical protein
MKSIRILIPILLLFVSCYTINESKLVSKVRFPSSEQKVAGEYYIVKEVERSGIENTYETVELAKASKYKYLINEQFERKKSCNAKSFFIGGTIISLGGGFIFANNTQWFSENTTKPQAYVAGVGVTAIAWFLICAPFMKDQTDHIIKPSFEFDYKQDALLPNTEVLIRTKDKESSFLTDAKGLLRFSPALDFHLDGLKTNDTIQFLFKKNNQDFVNSIKLRPSEWMNQYAKITSPKVLITDKLDGNLGYGREGMLYKVINRENEMLNIQVGSKSAWIEAKNADVFYTTNIKTDLTPAIKSYVVDEMQKWMQQGEFELPDDYLKRIAKKDEQLFIFTNEAMKTFQKEYVQMFDWKNSAISNYDPNSQTFKINIPALNEIVVNVPIEKAKEFKSNWKSNVFKNQEFTMIDGKWELVSLQIEDPKHGYIAEYNSKLNNNYDPVNQFAFDLTDFEPDLSKLNVNHENLQIIENTDNEKYSINTNLPKTIMQQPDAIAVVIGNALYQKTENVNYAINDAQLMKLYLTQVLGFKEGNIIFTMNAGKAEFEGLFGTDNNYKGKLFNYIKPDVSDVFIFYSGHGAPDPQTAEAYFVPTDCDPAYLNLQGYALKTLYANLAKLPSKSTTVIIDACFSGTGVLKNMSSARIKPKDTESDIPNSAILSSSTGEQVSSWYNEMKHGLFTYFFLKAIHDYNNSDKNGDKQLTFNEIYNYISDKTSGIPYFARRLNAVEQTPVLKGSSPERVLVKF